VNKFAPIVLVVLLALAAMQIWSSRSSGVRAGEGSVSEADLVEDSTTSAPPRTFVSLSPLPEARFVTTTARRVTSDTESTDDPDDPDDPDPTDPPVETTVDPKPTTVPPPTDPDPTDPPVETTVDPKPTTDPPPTDPEPTDPPDPTIPAEDDLIGLPQPGG
jgi:hypothetical protein